MADRKGKKGFTQRRREEGEAQRYCDMLRNLSSASKIE
jgi:hypothetical protein